MHKECRKGDAHFLGIQAWFALFWLIWRTLSSAKHVTVTVSTRWRPKALGYHHPILTSYAWVGKTKKL